MEAHLRAGCRGLRPPPPPDPRFNPPDPPAQASPPVCRHHPSFFTWFAGGLHPVPFRSGEILLWQRPY